MNITLEVCEVTLDYRCFNCGAIGEITFIGDPTKATLHRCPHCKSANVETCNGDVSFWSEEY
jgi:DNA-directed RNA polymerase subunit RPC12/RpoP